MKLGKMKFSRNDKGKNDFPKIFKGIILISLVILAVFLAGCQEKEEKPKNFQENWQ